MKKFMTWKRDLYPLLALAVSIWCLVTGLVFATAGLRGTYFLLLNYAVLLIFLPWRATLKPIPLFLVVAGIFFGVYWGAKGQFEPAIIMVNRIAALFLGVMPGLALKPVSLVRNLEQIHCPKFLTLGVLISSSFFPLLNREIKRIKEAMGTRGVSVLQPKNFYRAFMVPFVVRLVNISDTLSLSVETRGFKLGKNRNNTIYKREMFTISDLVCSLSLIAILMGVIFI